MLDDFFNLFGAFRLLRGPSLQSLFLRGAVCRLRYCVNGLADWWWRCLAGSPHHWPGSGLRAEVVPAVWRSGGSRTYPVTLAVHKKTHDTVDDGAEDEEDEEE